MQQQPAEPTRRRWGSVLCAVIMTCLWITLCVMIVINANVSRRAWFLYGCIPALLGWGWLVLRFWKDALVRSGEGDRT